MGEVAKELEIMQDDEMIEGDRLEDWKEIEENFAFGGTQFGDQNDMDVRDKVIKEMKLMSHDTFEIENKAILRQNRNEMCKDFFILIVCVNLYL